LLNFPLYNGLKSLQIGIPKSYTIKKDTIFQPKLSKPIVFYGTSISQGACASRAGMAYPSILGRKLGVEVINLGFSGNGKLEPALQDLLAQIDAAMYVIDCHRNTSKEEAQTHIEFAIRKIRKAQPTAPIIVIEGSSPSRDFPTEEGIISQQIIKKLKREGFRNLYYLQGDQLLGQDTEGTVDLVHPTDLGLQRYATYLLPFFKKMVKKCK
jgi:lysophospholipase L1-like esterase